MLNFIIYDGDKSFCDKYISIILKIIGNINVAYKIVKFHQYDEITIKKLNSLIGKKIYILEIDVPGKSGLDLAQEIRKSGDWESQIIIVTKQDDLMNKALSSKMMILDFISKFYNCEELLRESLLLAVDILSTYQSLSFQLNGEIIQIPYKDILFIEKNVDNPYCTVVTRNGKIEIRKSISKIYDQFNGDSRFFKTHRSCVVNLHNITNVELRHSIIYFNDIQTTLLARDKKSELKNILCKKVISSK